MVCAPNAFKGSLTAAVAAAAIARGVRDAGGRAVTVPVADGGDGTLPVVLAAAGGAGRVTTHRVTGPAGRPVTAHLGWLNPTFAVVEMAEAAGLRRVPAGRLDAMTATSRGAGELLSSALQAGATRVLVGVGGSASTDGGAGLLQALGARLTDAAGGEIGPGGAGLEALRHIDVGRVLAALEGCRIEVALDVRNPLLGPSGAAAVFGPQKGAAADQVRRLDQALAAFAAVVAADTGRRDLAELPGAGAAGGCGFALALLGAELVPGAALVCDIVGLDRALETAAAVITGPAEVAARAHRHGLPCAAIAGQVDGAPPGLFDLAVSLEDAGAGLDPRRHARSLLRQAARTAATALLDGAQ
ncbi:MAG: glycerate kinase [Chloroflexi bacterium]|nr:MAG: glycerate kinase [Chloroflexota bacterium]